MNFVVVLASLLPFRVHGQLRMGSACECGKAELFVLLMGWTVLPAARSFSRTLLCKSLHCGMLELEDLLALPSTALTWDLQGNDDQTRNGQRRQAHLQVPIYRT